jgi:putative membrane protein
MRRLALLSLVFAGAFLCLQPLRAQIPGAGGAPGQGPTTPSTFPGQNPSPGATGSNTPIGPGAPENFPSKIDDRQFARDAAIAGLSNVELAELAAEKASSEDVRQFGKRLLDDQTKTNDRLKQVANQQNILIPDALDSKHQSLIDKVAKLSGPEFDKAFLKQQLKEQEAEVRDFSDEAQRGTDPNVKTFAAGALLNLQQQLEAAKNLNKSTKKAKGQ